MNILNDYYSPDVLSDEHKFSESGIYHQLPLTADHEVYLIAALVCEHRYFSSGRFTFEPISSTQISLETGSLLNTVPEFSILFQEKVALEFFFWSFLQNEITCKFLWILSLNSGYRKISHELYLWVQNDYYNFVTKMPRRIIVGRLHSASTARQKRSWRIC